MALDSRRCFASQFTEATAARNDDPMLVEGSARRGEKMIPEDARAHHVGQQAHQHRPVVCLKPAHPEIGDGPRLESIEDGPSGTFV